MSCSHISGDGRHVQYGHALEVACVGNSVVVRDDCGIVGSQDVNQMLGSPHKELALDTLTVGILGRVEATLGRGHLPDNIVDDPLGCAAILAVGRHLVGVRIETGEQCVVVQHLLEVRHKPECVRRVPVESSAYLIVDSAGRHLVESELHHLQR